MRAGVWQRLFFVLSILSFECLFAGESLTPERFALFQRIFQQEEALDHRITKIAGQEVEGEKNKIDQIKLEVKELDKIRRRHELKVKWLIICPASFCVNYVLAATQLAQFSPPASTALSAAIGSFAMVYVFDATDKYWNRFFNEQISDAVSAFDLEATKILREDDLDRAYSQEVDFVRLEKASAYLDRSEAREKVLLQAMRKTLADFIRKRNEEKIHNQALKLISKKDIKDPQIVKAIEAGEEFEEKELGGIRTRYVQKKLEIAYQEKIATLLQQRLRLIKSLRAKIEFGDNRFQRLRGSDRTACVEYLRTIAPAVPPSPELGPQSKNG